MKISRSTPKIKWFSKKIDAETWEDLPDDAEGEGIEEVRICIKHLNGGEIDSLQDRRIKTNVGRAGTTLESDYKYSTYANQKRVMGLEDWEGVIDEDTGEKMAITAENMKIVPGWLATWILNKIDELSELGEERRGE